MFDAFDRVVVLNLERRPDRLAEFHARFPGVEVVAAIDGKELTTPAYWPSTQGAYGCLLSHIKILSQVVADGVGTTLVLEDDAMPVGFTALRLDDFLGRVPDWDALMLGGQHLYVPEWIAEGIVRCRMTQRTHAYVVKLPAAESLLGHWQTINAQADQVIGWHFGQLRVYAPDPFLFVQSDSPSDITD